MLRYLWILALMLPIQVHGQGVLENMQADIGKTRVDVAALTEELKIIKAQLQLLLRDNEANKTAISELQKRVAAIEKIIVPPEPPPPPPVAGAWNLELLGGWRVKEDFARGSFTIDYATMTLYMAGHAQRRETKVYTLGDFTPGSDLNNYKIITPTGTIPKFWTESSEGQGTYADNYCFMDGILWVAPRTFYEMRPVNFTTIYPTVIGASASRAAVLPMTIKGLRSTAFGGFVKSAGKFPMLGGGGYESGQGSAFGPTLGSFKPGDVEGYYDGTTLIDYPWAGNLDFSKRAPRFPNYQPVTTGDTWVALHPRDVNGDGVNEGCWASDIIKSGGIAHATGIYYWACLGTGLIDYKYQSTCLAKSFMNVMYRYDPVTYKLLSHTEWPGGTVDGDPQAIIGSDISPDGKYLYLMQANQWKGGLYKVDSVLRVYAIK